MDNKIHLICRDRQGIHTLDAKANVYASESWLLSAEDAALLEGGTVFLHQTKGQPSYFGGVIQSVQLIDPQEAQVDGRQRYQLIITSTANARNVAWEGQSHGMAWSSGVLGSSTKEPYELVTKEDYFRGVLGTLSKAKRQDELVPQFVRFGRTGSGQAPHYQVHFDDGSVQRMSGLSHELYHEDPHQTFEQENLSPGHFALVDVQRLLSKILG